uniref:Uncharacterized protein n=1 Tax=Ixodes ricinus TaxID=34613 RepID=A0A6B0U554_IXORI
MFCFIFIVFSFLLNTNRHVLFATWKSKRKIFTPVIVGLVCAIYKWILDTSSIKFMFDISGFCCSKFIFKFIRIRSAIS